MAYRIRYSNRFNAGLKRCHKRGLPMAEIFKVIDYLAKHGTTPAKTKPHPLVGEYKGCMECHIKPDWLLIWKEEQGELVLVLIATGTHAELFG